MKGTTDEGIEKGLDSRRKYLIFVLVKKKVFYFIIIQAQVSKTVDAQLIERTKECANFKFEVKSSVK